MISFICLWWIGTRLNAGYWYYVLLVIRFVTQLFNSIREAELNQKIKEHLKRHSIIKE